MNTEREIMKPTVEPIPRTPVESSAIKSYGYDADRQLLDIEFPTPADCSEGPVWRYDSVKAEDVEALVGAESIGKHWHQLKKHLSGKQISGPLPKKKRGAA